MSAAAAAQRCPLRDTMKVSGLTDAVEKGKSDACAPVETGFL
jgi:hypothetical protein